MWYHRIYGKYQLHNKAIVWTMGWSICYWAIFQILRFYMFPELFYTQKLLYYTHATSPCSAHIFPVPTPTSPPPPLSLPARPEPRQTIPSILPSSAGSHDHQFLYLTVHSVHRSTLCVGGTSYLGLWTSGILVLAFPVSKPGNDLFYQSA